MTEAAKRREREGTDQKSASKEAQKKAEVANVTAAAKKPKDDEITVREKSQKGKN